MEEKDIQQVIFEGLGFTTDALTEIENFGYDIVKASIWGIIDGYRDPLTAENLWKTCALKALLTEFDQTDVDGYFDFVYDENKPSNSSVEIKVDNIVMVQNFLPHAKQYVEAYKAAIRIY